MNALVGLCRLKPGGIHKGEKQKLLKQNEKKISHNGLSYSMKMANVKAFY